MKIIIITLSLFVLFGSVFLYAQDSQLSIDFWKIVFPLGIAILVWGLNERSKLKWEQRKHKEECYKELLSSLVGLCEGSWDKDDSKVFVQNVNRLWLYASDDIIKKTYDFTNLVTDDSKSVLHASKEEALGKLVEAMRKEMSKRTTLTGDEFKLLAPGTGG